MSELQSPGRVMRSSSLSEPELLSRGQRRAVVAGIVGLHAAAGWGLLQVDAVRQAVVDVAPVFVSVLAPEAAPPAPAPPPPPAQPPAPRPKAMPKNVIAASPSPDPSPAPFVAPEPAVREPAVTAPAAPAAPPAPPAPPQPAPPAGPRTLPPSAIQYLVSPVVEYPRASRRLRETGRAQVRVLIDEAGLPRTVELVKSTGHPLLDEAALAAVRKARFKPYTENGQAMSGWALIPLSFDLEN